MSSDVHYNPWPLGKLPDQWQRPEPQLLRDMGYTWSDPRDIVGIFEEKVAKYAGSRFAVAVDCCSHAIFLSLKFRNWRSSVSIPRHTYISVPMQILHAGATVELRDEMWQGVYELRGPMIIDGAARFTQGMYVGDGYLQTLSFQIKKRLPIGRGGMILTDDPTAYAWLKKASYDGRDLLTPYESVGHVSMLGWHHYMTPEDAARGVILMDQLPDVNSDVAVWSNYPPVDGYEWSVPIGRGF